MYQDSISCCSHFNTKHNSQAIQANKITLACHIHLDKSLHSGTADHNIL